MEFPRMRWKRGWNILATRWSKVFISTNIHKQWTRHWQEWRRKSRINGLAMENMWEDTNVCGDAGWGSRRNILDGVITSVVEKEGHFWRNTHAIHGGVGHLLESD